MLSKCCGQHGQRTSECRHAISIHDHNHGAAFEYAVSHCGVLCLGDMTTHRSQVVGQPEAQDSHRATYVLHGRAPRLLQYLDASFRSQSGNGTRHVHIARCLDRRRASVGYILDLVQRFVSRDLASYLGEMLTSYARYLLD